MASKLFSCAEILFFSIYFRYALNVNFKMYFYLATSVMTSESLNRENSKDKKNICFFS